MWEQCPSDMRATPAAPSNEALVAAALQIYVVRSPLKLSGVVQAFYSPDAQFADPLCSVHGHRDIKLQVLAKSVTYIRIFSS